MTLTPQFLILAVVTTGAGYAMFRLGIGARMLDARAAVSRRCASCGRRRSRDGCAHCVRR
jgi:hypothetical protein